MKITKKCYKKQAQNSYRNPTEELKDKKNEEIDIRICLKKMNKN